MKYMGSKARIAKFILPIMLEEANNKTITTWVEPFVGGGNMIDKVPKNFKRIGIDVNPHCIAALTGIRDKVNEFPSEVSEEYYKSLRGTKANPITSWVRFVCSYGGKFENGYARQGNKEKYRSEPIQEGKRNAIKQSPNLQNIDLICDTYENYSHLTNCLIYCDPPYLGTTSYKTSKFNHDEFYNWCRKMSKNNSVFVSEYAMPEDFTCVWKGEIKTNFASQRDGATHTAIEKLFKYKYGN